MAQTRRITEVIGPYKTLAIIGVKGLPPEFPGTSGVEYYVAMRLPILSANPGKIVCYVRPWATPKKTDSYMRARLLRLPSIRTTHLDAISHAFFATLHACFSDADVLWYQATGPALFTPLPRLFGKRVVVTVHTLEWRREKWGAFARVILRLAERVAMRCASEVFAVSEEIAVYINRQYRRTAHVDVPIARRAPMRKPDILRTKYGLLGGDYILFMGRFVPEKRLEWLIEAFRSVRGPHGTQLVLAGGESNSRLYAQKLRSLAGNDPAIRFIGWVFGEEKEEILAHCRCFVLPSAVEGNPTVLYELPLQTPIIVSQEISRSLPPNFNVRTYPSDDRVAFTKALRAALFKP